jgi:hypothetical protein
MPRSQRPPFAYADLRLPAEAINTMPDSLIPLWDDLLAAQAKHAQAEQEAVKTATAVRNAHKDDQRAAADAVAAGKKMPEPTIKAKEDAHALTRRTVDAHAANCDRHERAFLAAAEDARDEWLAAISVKVTDLVDTTVRMLAACDEPLADLAATEAVRVWLRRYPAHRRLGDHSVGPVHPLGNALGAVVAEVGTLRPEEADAALAAHRAETDRKQAIKAAYPTGVVPRSVDPATVT